MAQFARQQQPVGLGPEAMAPRRRGTASFVEALAAIDEAVGGETQAAGEEAMGVPTYLPTYTYLPIYTYLYLPMPTYKDRTYLYLPIPTYGYLYLPIYTYLPTHIPRTTSGGPRSSAAMPPPTMPVALVGLRPSTPMALVGLRPSAAMPKATLPPTVLVAQVGLRPSTPMALVGLRPSAAMPKATLRWARLRATRRWASKMTSC